MIRITNGSLARTEEEDKAMAVRGVGIVPNGLVKTRLAIFDDFERRLEF
jgi:hypothetical protein